jgi:hypothetical protein
MPVSVLVVTVFVVVPSMSHDALFLLYRTYRDVS